MRRLITAACSLTLVATLSLAAAQATEPATQATAPQASAKSNPGPKAFGGTCLKSTGSRIVPKAGKCVLAPGHVYTQRQLDTTGKTDTASALGMLAPNLTVSHH